MNNDIARTSSYKVYVINLPIGAGETIWYCWPLIEMVWTGDAPADTAEDTTPPDGLDAGDPSSAPSSVVDT